MAGSLIAAVPSYLEPFDPRALIDAVNALHALGHDRAVAALEAHLRAPGDHGGAFLVMRALFEVPDPPGYLPVMQVGAPSPAAPADPRVLPRFPLAIVDDVPLLVTAGYLLGGKPESAADHLARLAPLPLRAAPLAPGDPAAAVEAVVRAAQLDDATRARLVEQAARLEAARGPR